MRRSLLLWGLTLAASGCADTVTDLVRYGAVEVETIRRSGEAVSGSRVILYNGTFIMDQGVTGAEGSLRFEFVPPDILGSYGAYAEPPKGYRRPEEIIGGPTTAFIDGIRLKEGEEGHVSFTYVKEGPGRMEVTVEEPDGSPVEGAKVFLYASAGDLAQATVGESGRVVFDPVSFGNRGVRVMPPPGYLFDGEVGVFRDGILIEDGWSETVDFTLEKCPGIIRGRVLDQNGSPARGVRMLLYTGPRVEGIQETGDDGETSFVEVGCQDYGLALATTPGWVWEEGRGKSFYDGIIMTPGDERSFTFNVQRRAFEMHIRVEDQFGGAVPEALLELYTSGGPVTQARTDAEGSLLLEDVPCGQDYGIRIFPPEGYSVPEGRGTSYFDGIIPEADESVLITFVLTRL